MPTLAEKFATNLKNTRLAKKLSQEDFAQRAGISTSYVSMLEREQRTPPLDTVEACARALRVQPLALLS